MRVCRSEAVAAEAEVVREADAASECSRIRSSTCSPSAYKFGGSLGFTTAAVDVPSAGIGESELSDVLAALAALRQRLTSRRQAIEL